MGVKQSSISICIFWAVVLSIGLPDKNWVIMLLNSSIGEEGEYGRSQSWKTRILIKPSDVSKLSVGVLVSSPNHASTSTMKSQACAGRKSAKKQEKEVVRFSS